MYFLFKNYSLVDLLIRWNKTKSFLWNTNNNDRNGVNKQNTHTKDPRKDNTGKGFLVCKISDTPFLEQSPLFSQTPPILWKKSELSLFVKTLKTQIPTLLGKEKGVPMLVCKHISLHAELQTIISVSPAIVMGLTRN